MLWSVDERGYLNPSLSPCHLEYYRYNIWISTPPLLIEDTSLTVYFCSDFYLFLRGQYYEGSTMRAAIREANVSTWNYTERFLSCYDYECWVLYRQNYSSNLVTSRMFNSLMPNTLHTLEFLGCSEHYYDRCTVGSAYFSYSITITTRPEGG